MVGLIDNYDSFTYNLYQYICELGYDVTVIRNDRPLELLDRPELRAVVISPGPGTPEDAGISAEAVTRFQEKVPVLGVCLGHQTIGAVYGGRVVRAPQPVHGKTSMIAHDGRGLFAGMPSPCQAGRYHSLIVEEETLPDCLEVTARSEDGLIMALRHRRYHVAGVQFHPESILTPDGRRVLTNFFAGRI